MGWGVGSRQCYLWQKTRVWFQQLDLIHLRAQEGIDITVLPFDLGVVQCQTGSKQQPISCSLNHHHLALLRGDRHDSKSGLGLFFRSLFAFFGNEEVGTKTQDNVTSP